MKKIFSIVAVLIFAVVFTNDATAQEFADLDKSPMDVAAFPDNVNNWRNSNKVVRVIYSRPQLKGRKISKLVKAGKKWRLGANETTEVTFYKDVNFGGQNVKAGTYSMYAIPGEKEWTIVLSSQLNVWGAYFHKDENDVVRVKGSVKKSDKVYEEFTMAFGDDMTMYMAWGDLMVSVAIK
jgi:hypothetical protein